MQSGRAQDQNTDFLTSKRPTLPPKAQLPTLLCTTSVRVYSVFINIATIPNSSHLKAILLQGKYQLPVTDNKSAHELGMLMYTLIASPREGP